MQGSDDKTVRMPDNHKRKDELETQSNTGLSLALSGCLLMLASSLLALVIGPLALIPFSIALIPAVIGCSLARYTQDMSFIS